MSMSGGYGELTWVNENLSELHMLFPFPGEVDDVRDYYEEDVRNALTVIDPRNRYGSMYAYHLCTLDDRKFIYFTDETLQEVLEMVANADYVDAFDCDLVYGWDSVPVMGRGITTVTEYREYADEMMYRYQDTLMVEYLYALLSKEKFNLRMKWEFATRMTDVRSWEDLRTYLDLRYALQATFTTSMMMRLYDVSKAKKTYG